MSKKTPTELLSLLNDHVFQRVFGQLNIKALADLLSVVLDLPDEGLSDLKIEDPNLYRESKGGKAAELDVRARAKDGGIIHIEVQLNPEMAFEERLAYLNSRIFVDQLNKGDHYADLKRTITIVLADFRLLPKKNKDCVNRFRWYNIDNGAMLLRRPPNTLQDWRDSLSPCKAQNAGVATLRRGFATQQGGKIAAKM